MSILSGYLWTWKNSEAADIAFRQFKKFYPDGKLFLRMDVGGDEHNLQKVCDKWGAEFSINPMHVGRCGFMTHYEKYEETGPELTRKCWPKENAFTWIDGIYNACLKAGSKYMIVMEDDTFILKPISILNKEFGIAVFEYNTNEFPPQMLHIVKQLNGNVDIPTNIFGNKGYGAGGGYIINCEQFIKSWDYFKPVLDANWDAIVESSHLIGWCDFLPQITIMVGGFDVVMNSQLVQTWYGNHPELYPTFTDWRDYEIVDFLKDLNLVKQL